MNFTDPKKMLEGIISKTDKDGDGINDKHEQPIEGKDVNPIPKKPFFKRAIKTARKTLAGENKAGKIGSVAKNIIKPFIPLGSTVDSVTDKIGDSLKTEQQMSWIKSRLKERSTWQGIVAVLSAVGVALSPDQKEAIIVFGVSLIGIITAFTEDKQ